MIINRVKQACKDFIKKLPPFKQYHARLNTLENDINRKINAICKENSELKNELYAKSSELSTLKETLISLNMQINALQAAQENTSVILTNTDKSIHQLRVDIDLKMYQFNQMQESLNYDSKFACMQHQLENCADKKQFKQLDAKINNAFTQMNYLYHKGLHPDFYEQALCEWFYQNAFCEA